MTLATVHAPLAGGSSASLDAGSSASTAAPATAPSGAIRSLSSDARAASATALGQRLFDTSDEASRDSPFDWTVHIYKFKHRFEIYYKNQLFRVDHAVFGRSRWAGGKQWEGDSRTPEGSYLITAKRRSTRFDWFLRLNYPNATDEERFQALRISHQLDARTRLGGQIGIHGTDSALLNTSNVNWTLGCISVDHADIDEMARLLPIGTLVVINP